MSWSAWIAFVLLFVAGACAGQPFPMRYRADLSPSGETLVLQGAGWRFETDAITGAGWTTVYTADFDRDGQQDFLIASHSPGNGNCGSATDVTVLLFDAVRRPSVWSFTTYIPSSKLFPNASFPFQPIWAMKLNGRALFLPTDCSGAVVGAFAPHNGRMESRQGMELAPYARWTGPLWWAKEEASVPSSRVTGSANRIALSGNTLEVEIGRKWVAGQPRVTVVDSARSRTIRVGTSWNVLLEALRNGWTAKEMNQKDEWQFNSLPVQKAQTINAQWETVGRITGNSGREGDCRYFSVENEVTRVCGARWLRVSGGTRESVRPDGRAVFVSHTAMDHTVSSTVRFQSPWGAATLTGAVWTGAHWIGQWGPRRFSVHDRDGKLLFANLELAEDGILVSAQGRLSLLRADGTTVTLPGRILLSRP